MEHVDLERLGKGCGTNNSSTWKMLPCTPVSCFLQVGDYLEDASLYSCLMLSSRDYLEDASLYSCLMLSSSRRLQKQHFLSQLSRNKNKGKGKPDFMSLHKGNEFIKQSTKDLLKNRLLEISHNVGTGHRDFEPIR
ncbi:hypothetical protein V6N13_089687 [Hibiscus sabdariffa]